PRGASDLEGVRAVAEPAIRIGDRDGLFHHLGRHAFRQAPDVGIGDEAQLAKAVEAREDPGRLETDPATRVEVDRALAQPPLPPPAEGLEVLRGEEEEEETAHRRREEADVEEEDE